jgi:hypothetical protein
MDSQTQSRIEADDKAVAIYHVVRRGEDFDHTAHILFELVQAAQRRQPGRKRSLYLDIEGHRNSEGGFDADTLELQKEFLIGFLAPFLSEIHGPLISVKNPQPQNNDIPETLVIQDRRGQSV